MAHGCMRLYPGVNLGKSGTALQPRLMLFKRLARAANQVEEKGGFAPVVLDNSLGLEGARIRTRREAEAKEKVAEEAKAMSSVSIAGSSAIIKETVKISLYAITAGERATNLKSAHTPRKPGRTHHHRLKREKVKEKG